MSTTLTQDQIKHLRDALCLMIGPYALIMPESEVILFRDRLQARIDYDEQQRVEKEKQQEREHLERAEREHKQNAPLSYNPFMKLKV